MKKTLLFLAVCLSLNLSANDGGALSQDRDELSLVVSYSTYDFEQNLMSIIFANVEDCKIQYKVFTDQERLKSVGGFEVEAGMNFVNVDISYYESGNYVLEMNDGKTESVYYFNINRPN